MIGKEPSIVPRSRRNDEIVSPPAAEPLVLCEENRMAHAAIGRLVNATDADPLWLVVLSGPSGIGKSHLVRYFLREARRRTPRLRLRAGTASSFVADLSEARLRQEQAEFHAEYSAADVLVLEDLSAIEGRTAAQRLLVVLLDGLKRSGGRALVTCSSLPGQLKRILPRLSNRLHGGLCVSLDLLGETGRRSFAKQLAASRQIPLSAEAADVLSREGPSTPRALLAALVNLEMASSCNRRDSDATLVRAQLGSAKSPIDRSLPRIARVVAEFFDVSLPQLRSSLRQKRLVLPRQVAMLLARELSGRPAAAIARFFGRKNHTTVVHACRRTRDLLAADPVLARDVDRLRRSLRRI